MDGWIKLHRKLLDWQWYDDTTIVRVFLHLLLKANFDTKGWHDISIERGQLVTSIKNLAAETHLSAMQIRRALTQLQKTKEITIETTNKYTIITICNYAKYQCFDSGEQQTNNIQTTNEQQTNNNQTTTTKEIKNIKKEKNGNYNIAETENFEPTIDGQKDTVTEKTKFEKEKSCAKKEKAKKFNPMEFIKNEPAESRELLERWLNYKQAQFGKSYKTEDSFKTFINRLNDLSGGNFETAQAIIEQSIANCYQGIFELKKQYQNGNTNNQISMQRIFEASEAMREYEQQLFGR